MASFNGNIGTPSGGFNLKVEYSYTQSVEGNYSDVTATGYVKRNNSTYYPYNTTSNVSLTIDGNTNTTHPSYNLGSDGYKQISTHSKRVYHNDDGTKSINISLSMNGLLSNYYPNGSVSNTITLPTIPRASAISSVTTANIGSNATITVDRKSSSFTHTIYYYFGDLSGTIVTKSSNTSINWTIPTSFYAKIPNSKTGNGTLQIYTYSGNTQIGDAQTKTYTVTTNESACKPTITRTAEDTNSTTLALTGNKYRFVKGYSSVLVNCSGTAKNNATMSSLKVYGTNVGTPGSTTQSGSRTLNNFNDTSISIVATDSRGYSTTNTLSSGTDYILVDYIPLTFSGSVNRDSPTGSALYITFSGKYYAGSFGSANNSLTISWKWRRNDSGTWTSWVDGGTLTQGTDYTINTSNNTYSSGSGSSQSAIWIDGGYNYQKDYQIAVYYNDSLVNTSVVLTLTKGQPIINWGSNYFNVNGDIKQNGVSISETFTWTPSIGALSETTPTVTYINRYGYYKKIGKIVFFNFYIRANITALNGTNNYAYITGLPYSASSDIGFGGHTCNIGQLYSAVANESNCVFDVLLNYIRIQNGYGSGAAKWKVTPTDYMEVAGSGFYFIA